MAFFSPLGALGALGTGYMEGRRISDEDSMRRWEMEGIAALGKAFQPQMGPIDQMNSGRPMAPPPGQASMPREQYPAPPLSSPAGDFSGYTGTTYGGIIPPRSVEGPARGAPAGLPTQARDAPPLMLTRERVIRELQDNPQLQQLFDANTTAEVGTNPQARMAYQATVIDRAVAEGKPLSAVINDPAYYPSRTTNFRQTSGQPVDPALAEGANPANFATGNASRDPRTGREVGFAGGPQTASVNTGGGTERFGVEGPNMAYARAVGYQGPERTPIGPAGPQGTGAPPQFDPQTGMPQLDLQTMAQRIAERSPGVRPEAMFFALQKASPLLNTEAKQQLALLGLQQKQDALATREYIANLYSTERTNRNLETIAARAAEGGANRDSRERIATNREAGQDRRLELTLAARQDIAQLSADTRLNIEDARDGRAELSAKTKKEIATLNSETRREINESVQEGRDRRLGVTEAGKDRRQDVTEAGRDRRQVVTEEGRTARAELSAQTRTELGRLSAETRREIAAGQEAGRTGRAELSAAARKEIAGLSFEARKEIAEKNIVSREAIEGLRAESRAEEGAANRTSREAVAGAREEGAEARRAATEAGRDRRFQTREDRIKDQFDRSYTRLTANADRRFADSAARLEEMTKGRLSREGRSEAINELRSLEDLNKANHNAIMEKIQAGYLPGAEKKKLMEEATQRRDENMARIEQYRARIKAGGGTTAAPAGQAAPQEMINPKTQQVIILDPVRNIWVDKKTGQPVQ